ncbi:MAG: hypothetical protein JSV91_04625 [Phycisphaerales bacterium]|nr:MAG: hypothetical protein JSV91_04625 [Phycisphaerales bacterium]
MRHATFPATATAVAMLVCAGSAGAQLALPTYFTYQGELRQAGQPVTGEADMVFRLFDAETDGNQVGDTVGLSYIPVAAGRFAVQLDFGVEVFNGDARWLEIEVEYPSGEGNWTTLSPRQLVSAAPYALQTRGLFCDDDLEVGIGTTNPGSPLHVRTAAGTAISAQAVAGTGYTAALDAYVASGQGFGVYSFNEAETGNAYAVFGETASPDGIALYGYAFNNDEYSTGIGVYGKSAGDYSAAGVYGEATSVDGIAFGVRGKSHYMGMRGDHLGTGNFGALGRSSTGVYGRGFGSNWGVHGVAEQGDAVRGDHQSSGNYGLLGTADAGVYGKHALYQTYGQLGTDVEGVLGHSVSEFGGGTGVRGVGGAVGVSGKATATWGGYFFGVTGVVDGEWPDASKYGVHGTAAEEGFNYGVYGRAAFGSWNAGVFGSAYADDGEVYAGYFDGDVNITGTLTKGGGSFKIDHPLDPENRYLSHSFVESPEMMNIYSGTVHLDDRGEAWIELPDWFEALNRDFRYQLTCIGGFAPVYIAEEIADNMFVIAGGEPGMKVCWQVTGVRRDPYARANPIEVESRKPEKERGLYLHPDAYGLPRERGIGHTHDMTNRQKKSR